MIFGVHYIIGLLIYIFFTLIADVFSQWGFYRVFCPTGGFNLWCQICQSLWLLSFLPCLRRPLPLCSYKNIIFSFFKLCMWKFKSLFHPEFILSMAQGNSLTIWYQLSSQSTFFLSEKQCLLYHMFSSNHEDLRPASKHRWSNPGAVPYKYQDRHNISIYLNFVSVV